MAERLPATVIQIELASSEIGQEGTLGRQINGCDERQVTDNKPAARLFGLTVSTSAKAVIGGGPIERRLSVGLPPVKYAQRENSGLFSGG